MIVLDITHSFRSLF
ncbi:MAG: CRISPR-associated DxTHG motif protein [Nitrospinales bacterium]